MGGAAIASAAQPGVAVTEAMEFGITAHA